MTGEWEETANLLGGAGSCQHLTPRTKAFFQMFMPATCASDGKRPPPAATQDEYGAWLAIASFCRRQDVVNNLIEHAANVNAPIDGYNALHAASRQGDVRTVQLLVRFGADPNMLDCLGGSSLHQACIGGHVETIEALLSAGADQTIKNNSGHAPLQVALEYGNGDVWDAAVARCKKRQTAKKQRERREKGRRQDFPDLEEGELGDFFESCFVDCEEECSGTVGKGEASPPTAVPGDDPKTTSYSYHDHGAKSGADSKSWNTIFPFAQPTFIQFDRRRIGYAFLSICLSLIVLILSIFLSSTIPQPFQ